MSQELRSQQGVLYIVPTPIGNLGDMVPRAVEVLQTVDMVAAEDTRHSGRLMQHLGVRTPLVSYHDHSESRQVERLLQHLRGGGQLALISDAGTPLISDPGYRLVREARGVGAKVVPIPGACAAIAALSASGLPSDRFAFEGFPPARSAQRVKWLHSLKVETRTMIFYESPHRLSESLADFAEVFGAERDVVLAREISKAFETFLYGTVAEIARAVVEDPDQRRGEIVLLVRGYPSNTLPDEIREEARQLALTLLKEGLSVKRAAAVTAEFCGAKKNRVYSWLLEVKDTPVPRAE